MVSSVQVCLLLLAVGAAWAQNATDHKKTEKLEERRDAFRVHPQDLFIGPSNSVSRDPSFDLSRLHFHKFPNSVRNFFVVGRPASVLSAANLRPDREPLPPSFDDEEEGDDDLYVHGNGNYDRSPSEGHLPLHFPNLQSGQRPRGYPSHFNPNVLPPPRPSQNYPPAFVKMMLQIWKGNKGGAVGRLPVGVYRIPVRLITLPHDGGLGEGKLKYDPMMMKQMGQLPVLILRLPAGGHPMGATPYGSPPSSHHNRPTVVYED